VYDQHLADVVWLLAWTGLRWSEARELRVSDLIEVPTGRGRRLHDLRHTAACLWLASGVSISTVQAWLGHSSLQTTQIYVHYLGDSADRSGLDFLNRRGSAGGVRSRSNP
jgi:integrase